LDMKGNKIGSASATIGTINLQQGTLQNVAEINGGGASGAITKTTSGALTLLGTNTYTGDTTVSAGTLQVGAANAGSTGSSAITVNGVGTVLAGTGTINGVTTVTQGTVKPGDNAGVGAGTLTVNNSLTVASTGAINLDISTALNDSAGLLATGSMAAWAASHQNDVAATGNDKLVVNGALSLSGPIVVGSTTSTTFGYGDYFNLMDWASLTGSFSVGGTTQGAGPTFGDLTLPGLSSGYLWDVSQFTATGVVVVVPEPSRAMLLFVGFTLALLRRRRA
jgi:autotransporter-associated beta strand protein